MDIKDIKKLYANPIQFYKESPQNIVEMPEKRDDNTLYIYGPIMVEHMRLLIEEIFGNAVGVVSSMSFKSELQNLSGEITLRINSPGGDIEEASAITNLLRTYDGKVNAIIDGGCHSAAIMPLMSVPVENRLSSDLSDCLIHRAMLFGISGNVADLEEFVKDLKKADKRLQDFIASNSKMSVSEVKELAEADTFLQPKEMVDKGIVSALIRTPKGKVKNEAHQGPCLAGDTKDEQALADIEYAEKRLAEISAGNVL